MKRTTSHPAFLLLVTLKTKKENKKISDILNKIFHNRLVDFVKVNFTENLHGNELSQIFTDAIN